MEEREGERRPSSFFPSFFAQRAARPSRKTRFQKETAKAQERRVREGVARVIP